MAVRIDIGSDTTIVVHNTGRYEFVERGDVAITGMAAPSRPYNATPIAYNKNDNKFLITSSVMEIFEEFINNIGYKYHPNIPMEIFFKWLAAMAECSESESIDDDVKAWIDGELAKQFKS